MLKALPIASLVCAMASPVQADTLADQRTLFQQAYGAVQAGQAVTVPEVLRSYSLYPWLEHAYLIKNFEVIDDAQVVDFLRRYPNTVMADELDSKLGKRLAEQGAWSKFLAYIPSIEDDTANQCYRVQALNATQQATPALSLAKQIWAQTDKALPDACGAMLNMLLANQTVSPDAMWQRIALAMEKGQTSTASVISRVLSPTDQAWVQTWLTVRETPAESVPTLFTQSDSARVREIIVFGLGRLVSKQSATAESLWQQAQQTFKFTPEESARIESALGAQQALRRDAVAVQRLTAIPNEWRTQEGNEWLIRSAAYQQNWQAILTAADAIKTDNPRDAAPWQYWKARALAQTGKTNEANTVFTQLAAQPSYYGFLAADQLNQPYPNLNPAVPNRTQRIQGLKHIAAIQRVAEWYQIGNREQGRKEWLRTLKLMDTEGMIAAAELAEQWGDPNLTIITLAKAKDWDNLTLRFPLLHAENATTQARQFGIQAAWVMGVIRRESAFDAQAASAANAFGLMQLILPTAKQMGQKVGITIASKDDVLVPATNIQLGSAYLSQLLKRFNGNYPQATAAYNAGPGRPPQWAPSALMNADQWIESIPFTETRDYVKAVLSYTTIYDAKLNPTQARRLSDRLQPIPPNAP